jgi:hypothetical protein
MLPIITKFMAIRAVSLVGPEDSESVQVYQISSAERSVSEQQPVLHVSRVPWAGRVVSE